MIRLLRHDAVIQERFPNLLNICGMKADVGSSCCAIRVIRPYFKLRSHQRHNQTTQSLRNLIFHLQVVINHIYLTKKRKPMHIIIREHDGKGEKHHDIMIY